MNYKIGQNTLLNQYFYEDKVPAFFMDILWAKGWRHFGSYFYRYSHLPKNEMIYSVLSLRINLAKFKTSK
ncbi:MAG TPA: hypothetical protein ENK21_07350, partial [Trueperaceae bacterium]|nr:hypothetical protein [Trueperaceae bacterium]